MGVPKERCSKCKDKPILITLSARLPKKGYKKAPIQVVGKMCKYCKFVRIDRYG
jgi:hypothetical protein